MLEAHLAELALGHATPDPIGIAVKLFGHEFTEAFIVSASACGR